MYQQGTASHERLTGYKKKLKRRAEQAEKETIRMSYHLLTPTGTTLWMTWW